MRTPTSGRPAVTADGTTACLGRSNVSGPGQNLSMRRSSRCCELPEHGAATRASIVCIGNMHDQRVPGRSLLCKKNTFHCLPRRVHSPPDHRQSRWETQPCRRNVSPPPPEPECVALTETRRNRRKSPAGLCVLLPSCFAHPHLRRANSSVLHPNLSIAIILIPCVLATSAKLVAWPQKTAPGKMETEIKVRLTDRAAFTSTLPALGFHLLTAETMERNVLFDTPENLVATAWRVAAHPAVRRPLDPYAQGTSRKLRLAARTRYARKRKPRSRTARPLAAIFERLGYSPIFVYEKLRTEWADNEGHIVVDVTPIGDFAELEGESEWIDRMAAKLGISPEKYLKASYGQLFQDWKHATGSPATNMTFAETTPQEANPLKQ